jgi:hypothetical protein
MLKIAKWIKDKLSFEKKRKIRKVKNLCAQVAVWQPWPYIGYSMKGEPMSLWFYRHAYPSESDGLLERNTLGNLWSDFWWAPMRWKGGEK